MKYSEIMSNNDIKYIMYVDASGDDGFEFREKRGDGSSSCYTVAAFLTSVEDIPHNVQILNNAKKIFGHKDDKGELKYTKVRRHFKSDEIHNELLNNLKGTLMIQNVFKQYDFSISEKPILSGLCHSLPISFLSSSLPEELEHFCIVIDHMKATEEALVISAFKHNDKQNILENHICYMDSKDKNTPLLQVADFFAGMYRSFFEEIYIDRDTFNNLLHSCAPCNKFLKRYAISHRKPKCLFDRRRIKIPYASYIKKSIHLLNREPLSGCAIPAGIFTIPSEFWTLLSFIDCKLNGYVKK